jgi:hypothetical protein
LFGHNDKGNFPRAIFTNIIEKKVGRNLSSAARISEKTDNQHKKIIKNRKGALSYILALFSRKNIFEIITAIS